MTEYIPTPFTVTVTIKPVDKTYCYTQELEFCNCVATDGVGHCCRLYNKILHTLRRLPECLKAEHKAKEVQE